MTYPLLALPFLALAATVLAVAALRHRPGVRWWRATGLTMLSLLVLTVVFDNVMIAADLFRYSEEHLLGLHVGLAPIEDLAWPLAAGLGLPAVQLLLTGGREDRPVASRTSRPTGAQG
ncbi:lycopene cyclase domain-containing protein [Nocardioides sp. zg-536]|uniref:Lycopene cyclase domain-containing protein n=1 Tax=Nocardioides faecalis TaxID=2803858 RepID=A0A939BUW7_9ACTN|nr:lycopene cyclase domain-containing protein [Nocardioides faecalis]MBM9458922.1 lycopene cyclase domain-containing protein [Nocardioides faecalis]MBS4753982.1 lycopene cyclase domain-containing protein [Nocardioides faecalis]QVI60322.1 lycopene cyclase domain-containing protein [Nocardioides faecalis]